MQRDWILSHEYEDMARFMRGTLRTLFTDLSAVPFSWFGQRGNISVANFVSIGVLIGLFTLVCINNKPIN